MSCQNQAGSFFLTFDFVVPTLAGALFFFVFHSFLLLPLRIEELGGNPSDTGFIMGISGVSMLFFTPLSGFLADRYGRKIFIVLGFAALFLTCAGFVFIHVLDWRIYALRMLQGVAFSLFFTSAGALVTEITPEGGRVQAMGIYGMFTILGYAVAPYVGKMVVDSGGFSSLFAFIAAVSLAGIGLALLVRENGSPEDSETPQAPDGSGLFPPLSKPLAVAACVLFISGWVFLSQFSFVSLSSRSAGVEEFYLFFVSFTVAVLIVRTFLGWAPDRYGISTVCPPFLFLSCVSVVVLAFSQTATLVAVSGALFGISHGFTYPSFYLLAMENSDKRARAKVFALCSASFTGGGMVGTFVSGGVAHLFGWFSMYMLLAAVSFAGFAVFLAARGIRGFRLVKGGL